jgi:hypothetical protein
MRLWILEGSAVMKRKVTMELTVEQAAKVHDLLGLGLQDAEAACLYTPQQEAAAHRAYDTVVQALHEAFWERLHDTP